MGSQLIDTYVKVFALLSSSLLFGGMLFFAASFAPFLLKSMPTSEARLLIRKAFPSFYLFVCVTSLVAAIFSYSSSGLSASILALIALSVIPTRQILMPAINTASDSQKSQHFFILHSLSVVITLAHIIGAGFVVIDLATL